MELRVLTQPTVEPVTLVDIKKDLRIDHTDDDAQLARYISSAREFIETRIQSKIAEQTLEYSIDEFPAFGISLPVGPVQSVTSLVYDDADLVEQTVDTADYYLQSVLRQPRIFPTGAWPTAVGRIGAVRIQYVAGLTPGDVPLPIKSALRLKVQELYDGEDRSRAINDLLTNYYTMVA